MTAPVKAALFLLVSFVVIVPIVIWNGTLTALDIKLFLARWIILAIAVFLLLDSVKTRTIIVPDAFVMVLSVVTVGYAGLICLIRPYADWEIFGDFGFSVLFFIEATVILHKTGAIRIVLLAWQISIAAVGAYYILQKAGLDFVVWQTVAPDRIGSSFTNRNIMVYFLVCSFPYGAFLWMTEKGAKKILSGISLLLSITAIVLCHSRVGAVILILTFPAYLLYFRKHCKSALANRVLFLTAIVLTFVICAAAAGFIFIALSMSAAQLNAFSHARLQLWTDTLQFIRSNIWFGHGAGCFAKYFPAYRSTALGYMFDFFNPVFNSHNECLEILVENGIVGLGLFLALVLRGTGIGTKNQNRTPQEKTLFFFSAMSLFGCLVFSLVGEASHMFVCSTFSWLSLAICFTCKVKNLRTMSLSRTSYATFICGTVLWCVFSFRLFQYYGNAFFANIHIKHATTCMNVPGMMESASDDLEKALRLQPGNVYALYQRAYIATAQGRYPDAIRDYEKIQVTDPYFENIHFNIGALYYRMKNFPKAIENFGVTAALYPTFTNGVFYLAESYYFNGQYGECLKWCNRLIATDYTCEKAKILRNFVIRNDKHIFRH